MLSINRITLISMIIFMIIGISGLLFCIFSPFSPIGTPKAEPIFMCFIFCLVFPIIVLIVEKRAISNRILNFAKTVCELEIKSTEGLSYLFHPLLMGVPVSKLSSYEITFVYGLKHKKSLYGDIQRSIDRKLQEAFDSCLHKLALDFLDADNKQMAFRKDYKNIEKNTKALKETKERFEIDRIYEEKDILQREVDKAKKAFNGFRNDVERLGYKTWPHYKAYVLLK